MKRPKPHYAGLGVQGVLGRHEYYEPVFKCQCCEEPLINGHVVWHEQNIVSPYSGHYDAIASAVCHTCLPRFKAPGWLSMPLAEYLAELVRVMDFYESIDAKTHAIGVNAQPSEGLEMIPVRDAGRVSVEVQASPPGVVHLWRLQCTSLPWS